MNFNKFAKTMVAISGFCVLISGSAFGATVEVGNAITSWLGKGEIHEIGKDRVLFHGALDGVIFIHQRKGGINAPLQAAKMHCLVMMNLDKNTKERASEGFCMITPNEESGMVYTEFQCASSADECQGEWTHIGGTGKYAGISGTTKFRSRVDIGPKEKGTISGYAVWPSLTYNVP